MYLLARGSQYITKRKSWHFDRPCLLEMCWAEVALWRKEWRKFQPKRGQDMESFSSLSDILFCFDVQATHEEAARTPPNVAIGFRALSSPGPLQQHMPTRKKDHPQLPGEEPVASKSLWEVSQHDKLRKLDMTAPFGEEPESSPQAVGGSNE